MIAGCDVLGIGEDQIFLDQREELCDTAAARSSLSSNADDTAAVNSGEDSCRNLYACTGKSAHATGSL